MNRCYTSWLASYIIEKDSITIIGNIIGLLPLAYTLRRSNIESVCSIGPYLVVLVGREVIELGKYFHKVVTLSYEKGICLAKLTVLLSTVCDVICTV